jgi:serine/threonine protein kinase
LRHPIITLDAECRHPPNANAYPAADAGVRLNAIAMTSWIAGTQVGPYELLSPIGAGGMGEVWKARDTRLGRAVAIKRLKPEHAERFQREARAIAAMNHPHICQLYDVGPDYLVMEYIEGSPLTGPLPTKDALRLALQIADALQEAHSRGILHRDLKPGNILVTEKGSAKLLDFGLAKLLDSDPDVTISHSRFSNPCRGRLHFSVY